MYESTKYTTILSLNTIKICGVLTKAFGNKARLKMQIRLYNALAVSVMLYRREAWSSTRAKGQMLQILEIKFMKRIKEYTKDDRIKNATTVCELNVETLEEKVYRHKENQNGCKPYNKNFAIL